MSKIHKWVVTKEGKVGIVIGVRNLGEKNETVTVEFGPGGPKKTFGRHKLATATAEEIDSKLKEISTRTKAT